MSREFKDGPMACPKAGTSSFLEELRFSRDMCLEFLQEHISTFSDTPWDTKDGAGLKPTSDFEKASLGLVTELVYQNDKLIFPPPYTRLSDELVYMAVKLLKATDRGEKYPYDFLPRGDIHPDRVPSGVGPIVWAHGLPFFPVYKGYYILTGRQHADWVGWHLQPKTFQQMKSWPIWTIGPVVAPGSAVDLPRTIDRQAHLWKVLSARNCGKGQEKNAAARDVVSKAHQDLAIVPHGSDGFVLTQIYHVDGYHVRVGPNTAIGPRADVMPRSFFSRNRIADFEYEASIAKPYSNQRNPRIPSDDEEEGEEEEEVASVADAEDDGNEDEDMDGQGDSDEDEDVKPETHDTTTDTDDAQASQMADGDADAQVDSMEIESAQAIFQAPVQVIATDDEDAKAYDDAHGENGDGDIQLPDDSLDTSNAHSSANDAKAVGGVEAHVDEIKTDDAQVSIKVEADAQTHADTMDTDDDHASAKDSKAPESSQPRFDETETNDDTRASVKEEADVQTHADTMETDGDHTGSKDANAAGDAQAITGGINTDGAEVSVKEEADAQPHADTMKTEDMPDVAQKDASVETHEGSVKIENAQTTADKLEDKGVEAHDEPMKTEDAQIKVEENVETTESKETYSTPPTTVQENNDSEVTVAVKSIEAATERSIHDTSMPEASTQNEVQTEDAAPGEQTQ